MIGLKDKNTFFSLSKNSQSKERDKYVDNYDDLWGKHRVLSLS